MKVKKQIMRKCFRLQENIFSIRRHRPRFTGHAAFFGVSANTFGHAVRGEGAPKASMLIAVVMLLTSVKKAF